MSDTVRVETDKQPWWRQAKDTLDTVARAFPGTAAAQGAVDLFTRGQQAQQQRAQGLTQAPTQERPEGLWGLPAVGQFFDDRAQGMGRMGLNAADFIASMFTGQKPDVWLGNIAFPEYADTQTIRATPGGAEQFDILGASLPGTGPVAEEPASRTLEDYLMGNQFDSSPYDNYMSFLMQQDEETMARINAMYNQLAESAGDNMQRVADVYDSARIQSGDVFGGSAQNIEDAYGSASQQAADQMARLGIEAAAPGVLDPMALSQAEAVSGIERAGAGAVDALTRYGASAQDFGGQMAQVGQQQGLEVSSQILRDMAQRQAEAAFMREQARADFNPYARAMQQMEAEQMFDSMGQPSVEQQRLMFQMQEAMAKGQLEYQRWKRDKFFDLTTSQNGAKPQMTPEEAQQYLDALEQIVPGY